MKRTRHRRYCSFCKSTKRKLIKGSRTRSPLGDIQYYRCNPCNSARMRAYYATPSGRAKMRATAYRFNRSEKGRAYYRRYHQQHNVKKS